jgi:hypothetical protein
MSNMNKKKCEVLRENKCESHANSSWFIVTCEVQYLEQESGAWRFPSFRRHITGEEQQ